MGRHPCPAARRPRPAHAEDAARSETPPPISPSSPPLGDALRGRRLVLDGELVRLDRPTVIPISAAIAARLGRPRRAAARPGDRAASLRRASPRRACRAQHCPIGSVASCSTSSLSSSPARSLASLERSRWTKASSRSHARTGPRGRGRQTRRSPYRPGRRDGSWIEVQAPSQRADGRRRVAPARPRRRAPGRGSRRSRARLVRVRPVGRDAAPDRRRGSARRAASTAAHGSPQPRC